jgi:autotransporter translocation and assembly factor TamB
MASRSRRTRGRWAWFGLFVLLGAVLLVGALFSPPVEDRLREFGLAQVNRLIRGRLEVGRLKLRPNGRVRLEHVRLLDPDGHEVLNAEAVTARVRVLPLLRHRVRLGDVEIQRPRMQVSKTAKGTNLQDAFAPRNPSPPSATSEKQKQSPWGFELNDVVLRDGSAEYRKSPNDADVLALKELSVDGDGHFFPGDIVVQAQLRGVPALADKGPAVGPLSLEILGRSTGTTLQDEIALSRLHLEVDGSSLDVRGSVSDGEAQAYFDGHLSPSAAQWLNVPLSQPVVLHGRATWQGGRGHIDARFPDENGSAHLVAHLEPGRAPLMFQTQATLTLERLRPDRWLAMVPSSVLTGTLQFEGGGASLSQLQGRVRAHLDSTKVKNIRIVSADVRARVLSSKSVVVEECRVRAPGASLACSGQVSANTLALDAKLEAGSLELLTRNLGVNASMSGHGSGTFEVHGTPRAPELDADVRLQQFAQHSSQLSLESARIQARVPNLRKLDTGRISVRTEAGSFQGRSFKQSIADANLEGGRFLGSLNTEGPNRVRARAEGRVSKAHRVLTLATLELEYGDVRWSLDETAHFQFAHGVRVDKFGLTSGKQHLELRGGLSGQRLDAHLEVSALDLEKLPPLGLPPELGLAGTLDGEASLTNTRRSPRVEAHFQARRLVAKGVSDINAEADLTIADRRADARVHARIQQADLVAQIRAPLQLKGSNVSGIEASVRATHIDLATLAEFSNQTKGMVQGIADLDFVASDEGVTAKGQVTLPSKHQIQLDVRAERAIDQIVAHRNELGSLPVHALVETEGVDLSEVVPAQKVELHGLVHGRFELSGTLDEPELHANIGTRSTLFSKTALGTGEATANYVHDVLDIKANWPHLAFDAHAEQRLGLASWKQGLTVSKIPFRAHLDANQFELSTFANLAPWARSLGGLLTAKLQADGTLDSPKAIGTIDLNQGRIVFVGFGDYRDVTLHAELKEDGLHIPKCEIHAAAGVAQLTLQAVRPSVGAPYAISGDLQAERFPVKDNDQHLANIQAQAKIDGEVNGLDMLVKVHFSRVNADVPALTRKDVQSLEANPDIVILGETPHPSRAKSKKAPKGAEAKMAANEVQHERKSSGLRLRLGLYSAGNFWVRGPDIEADVRANMGLSFDGSFQVIPPPGMDQASTVEVLRGHVTLFGRRLDVPNDRPAKITFLGGDLQNSQLDVEMVYNDRVDAITVTIAIGGSLSHPSPPVLSSDPPMDSSQLVLLMATGHLTIKRGAQGVEQSSSQSQAASVVGSFFANKLQKTFLNKLPLDTLTVESTNLGSARIEAGKYLTDKIYLGYTHNVITNVVPEAEPQNQNEVTVEYQLSRRWQLEATGGDEGVGNVSAIWTRDY